MAQPLRQRHQRLFDDLASGFRLVPDKQLSPQGQER